MGEPGRLPSMGSHRVGHDWSDLAAAAVDIAKKRIGKVDLEERGEHIIQNVVWQQDYGSTGTFRYCC